MPVCFEINLITKGQGVYTITNKKELQAFMDTDHHYDKFIVQSLVGNASWSSVTRAGKFYHVGTIPNKKNHTYVSDLRMMVVGNHQGFQPIACYARRARKPLIKHLEDDPSGDEFYFCSHFSNLLGNPWHQSVCQDGR